VKRSKLGSEVTLVSNIQMMKGKSTNIIAPLTRCKMETQAAIGKRYCVASINRIVPGRVRGALGVDAALLTSAMPTLVDCSWGLTG
jgi:hypothetical protein